MLHSGTLGNGAELVLVHGWGMNGAVWEHVAGMLSRTYRLTLPDLPGHGRSPHRKFGRSLADWADACLDVAPDSAIWIGWSLGGSIALEAALRAPRRVRALVLVTATPRFVKGSDWPFAMSSDTLAQFRDALIVDPVTTLDRFLTLQARGDDGARNLLRTLRRSLAYTPAPDAAALDVGLDLLRDTDLRGRLASLVQPTLWLFGQRDTLVPWRCSEMLPSLLPQARVEVVRGAAHAPFVSHLEASMGPMTAFLEAFR